MEHAQDHTKKILEDKTMKAVQQNQLNIELNADYTASLPHTTESISVYSFQNASMNATTLQKKHVLHR